MSENGMDRPCSRPANELTVGRAAEGAPSHAEVYHRSCHHWYRSREEYTAPSRPRYTRSDRAAREGRARQNSVSTCECAAMLDRDRGKVWPGKGEACRKVGVIANLYRFCAHLCQRCAGRDEETGF